MRRKKRSVKRLDTIWEVSDELWARIEPILFEDGPPPPSAKGGASERTGVRPSTASSFGCLPFASGTSFGNSSATTVRSIAGSNVGARTGS